MGLEEVGGEHKLSQVAMVSIPLDGLGRVAEEMPIPVKSLGRCARRLEN